MPGDKATSRIRNRLWIALPALLATALVTWLWQQTRSVNPDAHAHIDSALRELRGLDRTINQDVLRARFQLIDDYQPVLRSYRRIEQLEAVIATPPGYLDAAARRALSDALGAYQQAVTNKQRYIELFKYRSADLRELLGYLPAAATGTVALLNQNGDEALAARVNQVLQLTLLYNVGSEEGYAPRIAEQAEALAREGEQARSPLGKRRVRTFVLNVRRLLQVKPEVERLLARIFEEPVTQHEDRVAALYYGGYAAADELASRYRLGLYAACISLVVLIGYGVLRLQHTARALGASNERLEARVLERTAEIDAKNRELQVVLDNVEQALFTVGLDGRISRERSAALNRWFPDAIAGMCFWELLDDHDERAASALEFGWENLRGKDLPLELALDQLPRAFVARDRHYRVEYRGVHHDRALQRILVVLSDVTGLVENARREAEQREQLLVFRQLMADTAGFDQFLSEGERLVEQALRAQPSDRVDALHALHTLKGNCAQFGIQSLVDLCHALESELGEGGAGLNASAQRRLGEAWGGFETQSRALMGSSPGNRIELTAAELRALREGLASGQDAATLLALLQPLEREPVERRLARLSEQARHLARRLGKGPILVTSESNGVRLDAERWAPFWSAFVHMIRNALDHGFETPEERQRQGKPEAGQLNLRVAQSREQVTIEISDDGRGIDWSALLDKANQLRVPLPPESERLALLLRGGLSTKTVMSEISGRGAGVGACDAACRALGGTTSVRSELGRGTTFTFLIPSDDTLPAPAPASVVLSRSLPARRA